MSGEQFYVLFWFCFMWTPFVWGLLIYTLIGTVYCIDSFLKGDVDDWTLGLALISFLFLLPSLFQLYVWFDSIPIFFEFVFG